jgi:peptide/nickel transport system substrate-binding protein
MRHTPPGRRTGRALVAVIVALGLVAACSSKKDDDEGTSDDTISESTDGPDTVDTEAPDSEDTVAPVPVATDPPVTEPTIEAVPGGRIVVAGEAEVANPWTPAEMQCDSYCQMRARTFYDPLVVVDNDLNWRPFLAESVEVNDAATEFTVKLREGIKFHDGTDLDADAMILNLQTSAKGLLIQAVMKDIARDPACVAAAAGVLLTIGTTCDLVIEKIDDFTFKMFTGRNGDGADPIAWPGFPYYLGGQLGFAASPTWLAAVAAGTAQPDNPVGTGPFTFTEYAPGEGGKLVVTKNPDYWLDDADGNPLPYLDEIEFKVISDSQVRASALESGEVDIIATSDGAVVSDFEGNEDFPTILQQEYGETNYILLHLSKPGPLQSKEVRCALTQAIDKIDLIDTIANGFLDPANGPFSPGQEGYLADNGGPEYDPEAAAAAIEAYEAANGPVTINYSTTTAAVSLATAEYLQSVWGEIGVDVTITQIEQSKLINNALFGDPAFDAFGWRNHAGLFADQQFFWWHSSAAIPDGGLALNFGRLADPEVDRLLEESRSELDPAARTAIAEDLNRRFASECFIIPTSYTKWGVIHNTTVQGISTMAQPDGEGGFVRDGAGFPGQVWLTPVFVSEG